MGSSLPNKKVYDPIRKKWCVATPEECVRQKILIYLIEFLGYPPHAMSIEKKLSELPMVQGEKIPERRVDILCCESTSCRPLLLIECKGVPLSKKMLAQVSGYNAFIGAPLICLANDQELILGWGGDIRETPFKILPTYQALCDATRLSSRFRKKPSVDCV